MIRRVRALLRAELDTALAKRLARLEAEVFELRTLVVALARDDPWHRRELFALRETAAYELAYTEPEPLVSIAVTTRGGRHELLVERALASARAQTYGRVEIVVVGDAAGEATRAAVAALGDERIRFADLTQRYTHPHPLRHWLTASTLPRNEAHRLARGRWIADLDDDDALRPDAIERLLALAREQRLEVAYGQIEQHEPGGGTSLLGTYPPGPAGAPQEHVPHQRWHGTASGGALVHEGMRLFAREHVASDIGQSGDFFRVERMVRAGVRFGMLPEVVYDYFPSGLWQP